MAAHCDRSLTGSERRSSSWSYSDVLEVWEHAVEEQRRRLDELEQMELIEDKRSESRQQNDR